ncbi:MAG: cysteine desulfurase family protein [Gammaproteobacteria bacterium]|nr:cysteine desulfurase family protein [Gammaproteobacteria bacterium]
MRALAGSLQLGNSEHAEVYLDSNATVKPFESVVEAVVDIMRASWGNPSSGHFAGLAARHVLERAREAVAKLLVGVDPDDVILTSGGTESCNTVLASASADATVIISAVEHPANSVPAELAATRGANLIVVPVDANGLTDPEAFRRAVVKTRTSKLYVSVQWASGETGVIQPIGEIASAVHESRPDALLHVDAAQAVGRIPTPVPATTGLTAFSFSGHKLHGPQGIGVLAYSGRKNIPSMALIAGGGQERNRRSGTQNVSGAAGLAAALEERAKRFDEAVESMGRLRDAFESRVTELTPNATVNGINAPRTRNTSNICFRGTDGISLVAKLDALGIRCSQGSACSSGHPAPSHVLHAMGISEEDAYSSLRFSFSVLNSMEDVETSLDTIEHVLNSS